MTSGLIFGKFAPLTQGHIYLITQASLQVDELYVFLSFDQKFLNSVGSKKAKPLSYKNRFLALWETFKDFPNIHIGHVDESFIESYPEGAADYTKLIRDKLIPVELTHVFSSEPDYEEYFSTYFPECKHVIIDAERSNVDISATRVRDNPYKYWDFIAPAMQKHYVKTVCIIGIESTGKSTLTKQLASHFKTCYVEEVGRTICEEEYACTEQFMEKQDYEYIAMAHKLKEREYLKEANKVLISDTNNLITDFSFAINSWKEVLERDSGLLNCLIWKESYDLVIFLDSDVPWVYDPLRLKSTKEQRSESQKQLEETVLGYLVPNVTKVRGSYKERFDQSVKLIDELIKG